MITKEEIQKRHKEVSGKFADLAKTPRRTQKFHHDELLALYEGELFGLSWVLQYWETGYYEKERQESVSEIQD